MSKRLIGKVASVGEGEVGGVKCNEIPEGSRKQVPPSDSLYDLEESVPKYHHHHHHYNHHHNHHHHHLHVVIKADIKI
ncbi:hypothetical protein E2C01_052906 [Portunus trituberculatus]|uniref:Uncharacterized protein n=1 Tax=Portunus trituberculatus TaxID=210409 RepID=A0A5B7GN43_PORTR|nr:hypothetical protein [Portunus trituberculatus]